MKKIPEKSFYLKLYIIIGMTSVIFLSLLYLVVSGSTEKLQATLSAGKSEPEAANVEVSKATTAPKATVQPNAATAAPAASTAASTASAVPATADYTVPPTAVK